MTISPVMLTTATCQAYLDAARLRINTQHHEYNPGVRSPGPAAIIHIKREISTHSFKTINLFFWFNHRKY